jgi:hypothetical protein
MKFEMEKLIGLRIVALRGDQNLRKPLKTNIPVQYILFDDKETILEILDYLDFEEETMKRSIMLYRNKNKWEEMMKCDNHEDDEYFKGSIFAEANEDTATLPD